MSNAGKAILKKISVKVVCGEIEKPTKDRMLMRIYGQANGYRVASSQFGESVGFNGVFKAINHETGQVFSAGECFLPKVLESQLSGLLGKDGNAAEFAVDIGIVPANNAFGYEYRCYSVIEPVESPVIAALEEKMGITMLAAPAVDKAVENHAAPAKAAQPGKRK